MSAEILLEAEIDDLNKEIEKLKDERNQIKKQKEETEIEEIKISFFWVCAGIILLIIGLYGIYQGTFEIVISGITNDYFTDSGTASVFLIMAGFVCILWGSYEHIIFLREQSTLEYYNAKKELRKITKKIEGKEYGLAEKTSINKTIIREKKRAKERETARDYDTAIRIWNNLGEVKEVDRVNRLRAGEREEALDYDSAIVIWEELGKIEEAARVRALKAEQSSVKVAQKVVHGDEVTKTEIKDSVVSKSNIGSGGDDKIAKIKELKELHDSGHIDDDEFKQMKKEILGK